jgi:type I restriction enzyme R subunit
MNHEYEQVELPAIEKLKSLGYAYLSGAELSPAAAIPERRSERDVVLECRLRSSLLKINPWLNDENLHKIIRQLVLLDAASVMENNQTVHNAIVDYLSIEQDLGNGKKNQTVKIIDFDNPDNNDYLVVNQFRVQGLHETIIPDLVVFVNGLPLAVLECKSPYITEPVPAGMVQLFRYQNIRMPESKEGAEKLFYYNALLVSTCGREARMSTIGARAKHYMEWKDTYPLPLADFPAARSQELLLQGVFRKENLLNIIRNFTVFETSDGKVIKKICRYQQYRAVHKAIERLKTEQERYNRGGVIWHTQGSGKSLTMVFFVLQMRRDQELKDYKVVFITDRVQLDKQLTGVLARAQHEAVRHARNIRELKELLSKDAPDLITSTLQKIQEAPEAEMMEELNASSKIVVSVDEAHRSHYSSMGVNLNVALPNAPKIAFTGTPLMKEQKTRNAFGSYIDTYTIEQAVADGATLQIIYEGREVNTKVTGDSLDKLFDQYFADKTKDEKEAIKAKFGKEKAVLEAPQRIAMVAADLLEHYRNNIQPNGFKAQIVCASREATVRFKEALDKLPDAPESAVIISGAQNDLPHIAKHTNSLDHRKYIERFLKPMAEDKLSILIVKDMLLTGFDAPVEQVMYLDRKLVEHDLLQAIARVNRTREGKECGFVVDYYGLADYLKDALKVFSTEDVKGALIPIKDELPKLEQRYARVMQYFMDINLDNVEECVDALAKDEVRANFLLDFKKFMKIMDVIIPRKEAAPYIKDMNRLGLIWFTARQRYERDGGEAVDFRECGEKVKRLIEEHIIATGIDPKILPVKLFSPEFNNKLDRLKSPKAKASEIEHAIKHHITVNLEKDPEYYQKLSQRLESIIGRYHDNWDLLVENLSAMRGSMETDRRSEAEKLDLNEQEMALFRIIAKEQGMEQPTAEQQEKLLEATVNIFAIIRERADIVDFFRKETEVKALKTEIKRSLLKTFGAGDAVKVLMDRLTEQSRVFFNRPC